MTPRMAAAIKELDAAIEEEVERRLRAHVEGRELELDEVAQARAIRGLKKHGMLPADFKAKRRCR